MPKRLCALRLGILAARTTIPSALILATGGSAHADLIVINNGLAPPNATNVIDAADDFTGDDIRVVNVGCDFTIDPCPSPGAATHVEVVEGGVVGWIGVFETSAITMSGGSVDELRAYGSSNITLTDGAVGSRVEADEYSTIGISGGSITGEVTADEFSTISISGGSIDGFILAAMAGTVRMSGGTLGGTLGFLMAGGGQSATIEIVGSEFMVDGSPVPYGPIAAQTGVLSGVLAMGDPVNNEFFHNGASLGINIYDGTITLVPIPEPSTASLLAFGLAGMAAAGRRSGAIISEPRV